MNLETIIVTLLGIGVLLGGFVGGFIKVNNASKVSAKNSEELDQQRSKLDEHVSQIASLDQEVRLLKLEKSEATERYNQTRAVNEQLQVQLQKADERLRAAELTIAKMQGEREAYMQVIARQDKRIEELIAALAQQKLNEAATREKLALEESKVRTLENQVASLQLEASKLKALVNTLQIELNRAVASSRPPGPQPIPSLLSIVPEPPAQTSAVQSTEKKVEPSEEGHPPKEKPGDNSIPNHSG